MHTVADLIRLNARRFPDDVALADDTGARLTHRELSARAHALARGLIDLGVQPGDRVGVLSANTNFAAETFLGCAAAGAVFVPYNWRWAAAELAYGTNLTRPKVVLVAKGSVDDFQAVADSGQLAEMPIVKRDGEEYEQILIPGGAPDVRVTLEDPLTILFTGGTTGRSKGVVLSHRAGVNNGLAEIIDLGYGQRHGTKGQPTGLNATPFFHSASLLCVFMNHYITGGKNVMLSAFDEELFGDIVEREAVTSTFIIPNMIRRLVNAGIFDRPKFKESFQQLHTGGGLLRMPDKEAVFARMPDVQMHFRYGLTEAGPMVSRLHHRDIMRPELDGSIGHEYTLTEVQIQDDNGEELGPDELGEICVRGPSVMSEYFDNPKETEATMRNGWLHTGDLAVRTAEGYLFFRDRAKDMIKTGGENVYASEIEQLLYAHPAVMECGVLGVKSEKWDEEVRAVVALRPGMEANEAELKGYIGEHLARYKIPKVFMFLEPGEMPVNPSGKIVKARLREITGWVDD